MRGRQPIPGQMDKVLGDSLSARMPPSSSRVRPLYRDTTICYAYMCSYSYGCSQKTDRRAQVLMRRCMRYMPESMRIKPALSDFALDLLAKQRQAGHRLSPAATAILDRFRPNGPIRKQPV